DLPEDVRAHVHQFLTRMSGQHIANMAWKGFVGGPKVAPFAPQPPVPPAAAAPPATPAPPSARPRVYSLREVAPASTDAKLDSIMKKLAGAGKDVDDQKAKK